MNFLQSQLFSQFLCGIDDLYIARLWFTTRRVSPDHSSVDGYGVSIWFQVQSSVSFLRRKKEKEMYFKNLKQKKKETSFRRTTNYIYAHSRLVPLPFPFSRSQKFTRQETRTVLSVLFLKTTSGKSAVHNVPLFFFFFTYDLHIFLAFSLSRALATSDSFSSLSTRSIYLFTSLLYILPPVLFLRSYGFTLCTIFSWRARGERERDAGPIKKIITRFRGTRARLRRRISMRRAPESGRAAMSRDKSLPFFPFLLPLDTNTRGPCKRRYSNIAASQDVQKSSRLSDVWKTRIVHPPPHPVVSQNSFMSLRVTFAPTRGSPARTFHLEWNFAPFPRDVRDPRPSGGSRLSNLGATLSRHLPRRVQVGINPKPSSPLS